MVTLVESTRRPVLPAIDRRSLTSRLRDYFYVMYALVMHDIKNRFFGSGLGQIVMVLWPFAHIMVLLVIYSFTNRVNPYGESIIQYSAVSIFPFIIFNYVARWIAISASNNKNFLQYPIIRPLDILVARSILEIVSITLVGILLVLFVLVAGYDVMPSSKLDAIYAVLGTLFLALGMGFFNAPFAFIIPMWNVVLALTIILAWVSSGVLFVVSTLPEAVRTPLSYNPLLHCIEWIRVAYYSDYPTSVLDRGYVLECGLVLLTLGLVLNTLLRRFY